MPRLFVGLRIPPEITARLAALRGGLIGARWIEPEDYHVTLRFIGDVGLRDAREIDDALLGLSRSTFPVSVGPLGSFGGDRPRALIAEVAPSRPLGDLQADVERTMRRIGLAPEPRKFTPHVTLARLKNVPPSDLARYLAALGHVPSAQFTPAAVALFSSRDSVGGGPYVVEAEYPLRG